MGVTGTLCTNGNRRDNRIFHKLSCYITQEDLIQPLLTVQEIMTVAAQLKLPSQTSECRRQSMVILCPERAYTLHNTQYTLHATLHNTQYTLHYTTRNTQYTLRNTQHTIHTTHSTHYTLHATLYNTQYTLHATLHYTTHNTHYTTRNTQYTLYATLHNIQYILHNTQYTMHYTTNPMTLSKSEWLLYITPAFKLRHSVFMYIALSP
jgi:hypothetical protein